MICDSKNTESHTVKLYYKFLSNQPMYKKLNQFFHRWSWLSPLPDGTEILH